jgi:hypothetical protein
LLVSFRLSCSPLSYFSCIAVSFLLFQAGRRRGRTRGETGEACVGLFLCLLVAGRASRGPYCSRREGDSVKREEKSRRGEEKLVFRRLLSAIAALLQRTPAQSRASYSRMLAASARRMFARSSLSTPHPTSLLLLSHSSLRLLRSESMEHVQRSALGRP